MTLYLVLKHFSWISSWYREGVLRSNYRQAKKRLFKACYNSKSFLTISFWCNKLASFIERNHSKVYCIFSCQLWLCSNDRIFINCGWFQRVCKYIWGNLLTFPHFSSLLTLNLKKYVNWRLFCPAERNTVKSRSFECLITRILGEFE